MHSICCVRIRFSVEALHVDFLRSMIAVDLNEVEHSTYSNGGSNEKNYLLPFAPCQHRGHVPLIFVGQCGKLSESEK
jgi:hypothetical protein